MRGAGDGDALPVDLEQCRYSDSGPDLVHATPYISTTWDLANCAVLTHREIEDAYVAWE